MHDIQSCSFLHVYKKGGVMLVIGLKLFYQVSTSAEFVLIGFDKGKFGAYKY